MVAYMVGGDTHPFKTKKKIINKYLMIELRKPDYINKYGQSLWLNKKEHRYFDLPAVIFFDKSRYYYHYYIFGRIYKWR